MVEGSLLLLCLSVLTGIFLSAYIIFVFFFFSEANLEQLNNEIRGFFFPSLLGKFLNFMKYKQSKFYSQYLSNTIMHQIHRWAASLSTRSANVYQDPSLCRPRVERRREQLPPGNCHSSQGWAPAEPTSRPGDLSALEVEAGGL